MCVYVREREREREMRQKVIGTDTDTDTLHFPKVFSGLLLCYLNKNSYKNRVEDTFQAFFREEVLIKSK